MAYIRIIQQEDATGALAEDYTFLSKSYGKMLGADIPTPQVYRTSSIVDSYFHYGAVMNSILTNGGKHDREEGEVPRILVNFGVAVNSSCFY